MSTFPVTRVAIRFAYDGTKFDSFARQPGRRTVEGELLAALQKAGAIRDASVARYVVASRTDRAVSAWGNVCAMDVGMDARAVIHEAALPEGLWFLAATTVPDGFSPRSAAVSRTYRYHVFDAPTLDWRAMRRAARVFVGIHDYRNFCRHETGVLTRRRIQRFAVHRRGATGYLQVQAPNFLWEQVRRMVHAILEVGARRRAVEAVSRQIAGAGRPEPPADPAPLVLEHVEIPLDFHRPAKKLVFRIDAARRVAEATAAFYSGLASSLPTTRR